MPRSGYRKQQKLEIESVIAEILIADPSSNYHDVDYKLRSDAVWRSRLKPDTKLPTIGTIKNYTSKVRTKLRNSGSDRPWSILASSLPQDVDYISATDLPLVLKVWRIRQAHGGTLTLRQARWISRLSKLKLWDLTTTSGMSALFKIAAKYAGRQAAFGDPTGNEIDGNSLESHDLDGDLAFGGNVDEFDDFTKNEKLGLKVMHQVVVDAGQIASSFAGPTLEEFLHVWGDSEKTRSDTVSINPDREGNNLWLTEESIRTIDEIEDYRADVFLSMTFHQTSVLLSVMRLVLKKPKWVDMDAESKVSLVDGIVDGVIAGNWKSVADLAETKVWGLNQDWSDYLKEMLDE